MDPRHFFYCRNVGTRQCLVPTIEKMSGMTIVIRSEEILIIIVYKKRTLQVKSSFLSAGAEGIEPPPSVLETEVLPLN